MYSSYEFNNQVNLRKKIIIGVIILIIAANLALYFTAV